ncbi:MAG: LacI family DNA-binding transcriptional regulator [Mucilaginibacter sp.]|nr:LacI family DNA-binding transcriptional regulator [Mucilaginibacter sp.]
MNFESVTIKDIAKELGISASSVSRALNDSYEISERTKKLVIECARKLNYQPNSMARSLKQGNSKAIGVVVPLVDNRFFSQVIDGIESIAHSKGYNVIFTQSRESSKLEMFNVDHLTSHSIDGLLMSLSTETTDVGYLKKLHAKGLPIVFFDRICDEINTHKVIADNFMGALEGTTQLINAGYRKIAHITGSINVSITKERLNGYKLALERNNIAVNEQHIKYCLYGGKDRKEIENILIELLYGENRPDAIFTASDMITTTTFSLLHQLKFSIPKDIAILGFSNVQEADILNPSLSTIYQPGLEMGKKAAEMLIGLIETKRHIINFETVTLPTQVHIRNSSLRAE